MKRLAVSISTAFLLAISPAVAVQSETQASAIAGISGPAAVRTVQTPAWAASMLVLVNAQRAKSGARRLVLCAPLMRAAGAYARELASSRHFDHIGLDGRGPSERVRAAGYLFRTVGENIAVGQRSVASVMRIWLNSPGHRDNLLNPQYTHLGLGLASGKGARAPKYWVQDFGAGGRC